jgi:hypothetical protein
MYNITRWWFVSDAFGGAKEIRTPGLYNANVARYQLCYSPKRFSIVASLTQDFKGKFTFLKPFDMQGLQLSGERFERSRYE